MSFPQRDVERLHRVCLVGDELARCVARNGIDREKILNDQDTRWMVSMPLFDISEQVSRLSDDFLRTYDIPDAYAISGMRNRMAHGYGDVHYGYIADAVLEDVPSLVSRCREILREFDA